MQKLWFVFVFATLSFLGCKREGPSGSPPVTKTRGFPSMVLDGRGKPIKLSHPPRRIVVAGTPLYSEVLLDLGASARIVGVASSPNNPPALKKLENIGKVWPLNVEKVVSLQPDLILGTIGIYRTKLEQLRAAPVFTGGTSTGQIRSSADIGSLVKKIDQLLHGNTKRYKRWWAKMQRKRTRLLAALKRISKSPRPRVAIVYLSSPQASTVYLTGSGSPAHELLLQAHGSNVFATAKGAATSVEALLKADPDVIVTAPSYKVRFQQHRVLRNLRAVRKGRLLGIPPSRYTSTRFLQALSKMIVGLHPQLRSENADRAPQPSTKQAAPRSREK